MSHIVIGSAAHKNLEHKAGKTFLTFDRMSFDSISGQLNFYWDDDLIGLIEVANFRPGDVVHFHVLPCKMEVVTAE